MPKEIERTENSLCFDNLDVFSESVEIVRKLILQSETLFLDGQFPSRGNRVAEHFVIRNDKSSFLGGRVYPAEAVAVLYLQTECAALFQWADNTFGLNEAENKELYDKVCQRLKLDQRSEPLWLGAVEEGISDFGNFLCFAAAIRKLILNDKTSLSSFPGSKLSFFNIIGSVQKLLDVLKEPIIKDEMILGKNVAEAIVAIVVQVQANKALIKYQDCGGKQGIESTIDLMARSAKHGAELARSLYLEVFKMAKGIFPIKTNLSRQSLQQFLLLGGEHE